jgi:tetratricopeptide (TPR) repeat protein
VRLAIVPADPLAEISVFDGQSRLVAEGRNRLEVRLGRGLYLARTFVATHHEDLFLRVDGGAVRLIGAAAARVEAPGETPGGGAVGQGTTRDAAPWTVHVPPVAFSAAAPLVGSRHFDGPTAEAARAQSEQITRRLPRRGLAHDRVGCVYMFARVLSPSDPPRHPLASTTLCDEGGRPLEALDAIAHRAADGRWASCQLMVPAGDYRLAWPAALEREGGHRYEQLVHVPPGWRVAVFSLRSTATSWPYVSVHMGRAEVPFDVASAGARTSELLQWALAAPTTRAVRSAGVPMDELAVLRAQLLAHLDENECDPKTILCGTWLMLRAGVLREAERGQVLDWLRTALGDAHPDVNALAVACGRPHAVAAQYRPPMLRASWSALVRHTVAEPHFIPARSLAGRIAPRVYDIPLWLTWADSPAAADGPEPDPLVGRALIDALSAWSRASTAEAPGLTLKRIIDHVELPRSVLVAGLRQAARSDAAAEVISLARSLADQWDIPEPSQPAPVRRWFSPQDDTGHGSLEDICRELLQQAPTDVHAYLKEWEDWASERGETSEALARDCVEISKQARQESAFRVAEAAALRAQRLDPTNPATYTSLGEAYKAQDKWEEAEKVFRATIEAFPKDPVARNGLGEVYKAQEKWEEAEKVFRATIEAFPKDPVARNGLGEVYKAQEKPDAERRLVLLFRRRSEEEGDRGSRTDGRSLVDGDVWHELRLTEQDKDQVVHAMLACRAMRDQDQRQQVVDSLRMEIRSRINPFNAGINHIYSIVDTCADFPGALKELRDALQVMEGDSRHMQALDRLLEKIARRPRAGR